MGALSMACSVWQWSYWQRPCEHHCLPVSSTGHWKGGYSHEKCPCASLLPPSGGERPQQEGKGYTQAYRLSVLRVWSYELRLLFSSYGVLLVWISLAGRHPIRRLQLWSRPMAQILWLVKLKAQTARVSRAHQRRRRYTALKKKKKTHEITWKKITFWERCSK